MPAAITALLPLLFASPADQLFEERIRPLLAARCLGCHGDAQVSALRLDSREGMLKGGRRGPAVVAGNAAASRLAQAIRREGELKMPPDGKLPDADIELLARWIQEGAVWPVAMTSTAVVRGGRGVTAEQRSWWSFRPLAAMKPGATIDSFIAAKQRENGVTPAGRADHRTAIRRLSFDLTGLPPANVNESYDAALERMLASPQFGERWGRYWLDIARYGEDDFRGLDQEKYPNAWRYRDWVVEAFNRDLPYDVFLKAQLAADLMEGDHGFDLRPALGFLGLGPWHYGISPPPQARADERHDRIDAVTRGFLGLTVACARCHDHKFDPISTRDYYALGGVFASTSYREFPLAPEATVAAFEAHQQKLKAAEKRVADWLAQQRMLLGEMLAEQSGRYIAAVLDGKAGELNVAVHERWKKLLEKPERDHALLDGWRAPGAAARLQELISSVIAEKKSIDVEKEQALERSKPTRGAKTRLPNGFETYDDFCPGCDVAVSRTQARDRYKLWEDLFRSPGGVVSFTDAELEPLLAGEWRKHWEFLKADVAALKQSAPAPYPFLHAASEREDPKNLKVALKGDPYRLGEEVPRRFIEALSPVEGAKTWTEGSGRRELAEAIVAQPLAARVAANRIWMKMTGRAPVVSASNFGRYGDRPSHPELLDYLAARLVANKWSVKALIREIAKSETYRRASDSVAANENADAANKWFWRANRRRLDAESLRDSLLWASGLLDASVGGASEELDARSRRRTLYGRVSRFKLNETLQLFDFPNPSITSEKRDVTHVPLQRLYFLNSEAVAKQADALAARVAKEGGATDESRLGYVYGLLYQRAPSAEERRLNREFLAGDSGGWKQLAQVLLSSNEFLFVD